MLRRSFTEWLVGLRPVPLPRAVRSISQTTARGDANAPETHHAPAKETLREQHEIAAMDRLLRQGRARSDPAHSGSMPMRSPILWSEALLSPPLPPPSSSFSPNSISSPSSAPSQDATPDLTPRPMHASYTDLILPFASEPDLLDRYTNASGGIRTGKLLEHLDSLAGSISYKHVLGPGVTYDVRRSGFYIVTAAVDRLDMLAPLNPVRDLRLSGQVIYTGKSSMEVAVKMEALPMHGQEGGEEKTLMVGRFSMVCRDARTHKARAIPGLKLETPEDEALHAIGEAHKSRRQSLAQRSLERVPPTSEEAADLHAFYLKYGNGDFHPGNGEERVWMGDTTIEKCLLMFPQERNIHQKIFGGYLMRLAYELGFANARLFTRAPVRFLSLDKIAFAAPVPIGSILRLRSRVLYSESSERWPALVHIGVQANVVEPETGSETTTNDFRFTWCRDAGPPLTRKVVPQTYKDAMLWLEAKRNLEIGDELRGLRTD